MEVLALSRRPKVVQRDLILTRIGSTLTLAHCSKSCVSIAISGIIICVCVALISTPVQYYLRKHHLIKSPTEYRTCSAKSQSRVSCLPTTSVSILKSSIVQPFVTTITSFLLMSRCRRPTGLVLAAIMRRKTHIRLLCLESPLLGSPLRTQSSK